MSSLLPRRIALGQPALELSGEDPSLEPVAQLFFNTLLCDVLLRHPAMAVTDLDDAHVQIVNGAFVAVHQLRVDSMLKSAFEDDRRDEVIWFELGLPDAKRAALVARQADGSEEKFDAVGGSLFALVGRCLGAWLAARGLPPLEKVPDFDAAAVVDACRRLAPLLAKAAESQAGWQATSFNQKAFEKDAGAEAEEAQDDAPAAEMEVAAAPPETGLAALGVTPPEKLAVPFLRVLGLCCDVAVHDEILALDPEHPVALREHFLAELGQGRDFHALRRVIAAAPAWGKPYLSLRSMDPDEDPDEEAREPSADEAMVAQGFAAVCIPGNEYALGNYAWALDRAGREPEAVRIWERMVALDPQDLESRYILMQAQGEVDRLGSWWHLAMRHDDVAEATPRGVAQQIFGKDWQAIIRNELASAYLNVGRLDEAIALCHHNIEGRHDEFPDDAKELERWRSSPELLARCYAREGYFRGDFGRVLEGFGRAEPEDSVDLAMFMDALVAIGRADQAVLAWAHLGRGQDMNKPVARVAASRALLATGSTTDAVRELVSVEHAYASHGFGVSLCRSWRLAAARPIAELEAAVSDAERRGGRHLGAAVARSVADFHPDAARSKLVRRVLGKRSQLAFPAKSLAGFGADTPARSAVDALFERALAGECSELVRADQLVSTWPDAVLGNVREDDEPRIATATAYVLAQALGRYLAKTTGEPGPLAGGLRQVAAESLQALGHVREALPDESLRALLAALEPFAALDARRVDPWLLCIERTLRLEERVHGRLGVLTHGLPGIAALLRGPELAAAEAHAAFGLFAGRSDGWAARALPLFERVARASDVDLEEPWAEAAAAALSGAERLDALLEIAALSEFNAAPALAAALELFSAGRGEDAFDLLCERLEAAGEDWIAEAQKKLKAPWKEAKLDVPLEFKKGASKLFECLQKGQFETAERIGRWLRARDHGNAEVHRNLGMAFAGTGKVAEALASFSRATKEQGTQLCSGVLYQQGKIAEAMAVLEYASRWFTRAEQWLTYGGIAFAAMDNPRVVQAYANAYALDPDALDASQLNAYAGTLDEVGDWVTCEKMSRLQEKRAGKELLWQTCAWHNLACALIGLERYDEAIPLAQKAVKKNPLPDNATVFGQTLERAKSRKKPTPPAPAADASSAFQAYLEGDMAAGASDLLALDGLPRRAALLASRFRFESENGLRVSPRATRAARAVLGASDGASDVEALLTRLLALELREQALFAWDEPPFLGDRWTRARFIELFRERGGIIVGEAAEEDLSFEDREIPGDVRVRRISEFAALLCALRGSPLEALEARGLTLDDYTTLCAAWTAELAKDPELGSSLKKAMARA